MTKQEMNVKLCAVLTMLDEVPYAPESSIYLAFGANMEDFAAVKTLLTASGLAVSQGFSMSITPAGHEMAKKIREFAAVTK